MEDKVLGIFFKVLFGIGGIIIMVVAWTQPMTLVERIFATSIGFSGLSFSLSRAKPLTSILAKIHVVGYLPESLSRKKRAGRV